MKKDKVIHYQFRRDYVLCNHTNTLEGFIAGLNIKTHLSTRFIEEVTCEECYKLAYKLGFDMKGTRRIWC